ncbi:MAG: type II toxin-antitoxin system HipA family toxin, partial [Verrucomicrobiota bacterium]
MISPGATYFAYAQEWLANGFSLSPLSVPFTGSAYRQRARDFDGLPGFLSDCLPDQWGRRLMLQEFSSRGETMTPLRMLAWVGRHGLGALSFEPTVDEGASARSWEAVSASLLVREAEAVLQARQPEAFARLRRGGTAGGALPKACVALLPAGAILIGGDVAAEAIQRPGSRLGLVKIHVEGRDVTRVSDGRLEHAYMRMCAAAGVRTARTEVLRDDTQGGALHHLFVARFDATAGKRLHVVTLAGLLHRYELHYRDLLLVARQLTQDHAEVLEATRRMIFNVRASNQDDHGKNHAFIVDERLQWRLSPAYDVTLNADEQTFSGLSPASFGRSPRLEALRAVA